MHPRGQVAKAKTSLQVDSDLVFSLSRRKLYDEVMSHFVIGNTNARSLFSKPQKKDRKLLYLGVGDIRNVLTTVTYCQKNVHVVINDVSTLTIARNIVLLVLAVEHSIPMAIAAWSDCLLTTGTCNALKGVMQSLARGKIPSWIKLETPAPVKQHWKSWLSTGSSDLVNVRRRALETLGSVGHGRAGASEAWLEFGVSSYSKCQAENMTCPNPTLFNMLDGENIKFVECQGPAGAFAELEGLSAGGTAFAQTLYKCWIPLFENLKSKVEAGKISFQFYAGDFLPLMINKRMGDEFDAIDTSNLMDYTGLWNILCVCRPCLRPRSHSFVFTEQILGLSLTLNDMLSEILPKDATFARLLAQLLGFSPVQLLSANSQRHEKVVQVNWNYLLNPQENLSMEVYKSQKLQEIQGLFSEPGFFEKCKSLHVEQLELVLEQGTEVDFRLFNKVTEAEEESIKELFVRKMSNLLEDIMVPFPMEPSMLSSIRAPIEDGYSFPIYTMGSLVCILQSILVEDLTEGFLESFFKNKAILKHPHLRNRVYGLAIQGRIFHCDGVTNLGPLTVVESKLSLLEKVQPKGGVLEPSVAVLLCSSMRYVEELDRLDSLYDVEEQRSLAFEFIGSNCGSRKVAFIDNIEYTLHDERVKFVLPEAKPFKFYCLFDLQQYRRISHVGEFID